MYSRRRGGLGGKNESCECIAVCSHCCFTRTVVNGRDVLPMCRSSLPDVPEPSSDSGRKPYPLFAPSAFRLCHALSPLFLLLRPIFSLSTSSDHPPLLPSTSPLTTSNHRPRNRWRPSSSALARRPSPSQELRPARRHGCLTLEALQNPPDDGKTGETLRRVGHRDNQKDVGI